MTLLTSKQHNFRRRYTKPQAPATSHKTCLHFTLAAETNKQTQKYILKLIKQEKLQQQQQQQLFMTN